MSPEELKKFYEITNPIVKLNTKEVVMKKAIKNILDQAKLIISTTDTDRIEIDHYDNSFINIWDFEIMEELKRRGYKVSHQSVGCEQEAEDYYYLHFI